MSLVIRTSVPPEASVAGLYAAPDLADAYAVRLPEGASTDPERLAHFLFDGQPRWIAGLLKVRDFLVAGFGLKTAALLRADSKPGGHPRIGIFRIYGRRADEIILGEDDSHLDFRVSVLRQERAAGGTWLIVSTVVHCHNALGRAYIALIDPFHRAVVAATLRRAAATGWPSASQGIS